MKKILLLVALGLSLYGEDKLSVIFPDIPDAKTGYPKGILGEYVKEGEDIINNTTTNKLSKDLVKNDLTCKNCHLEGGKTKALGTFIGTSLAFPAYSKREGTIQTLEDRINNCFMRSMNGKRPKNGSKLSLSMAAYIAWLSDGLPQQLNPNKPVTPYYTNLYPKKELVPLIKKATHQNFLNGKKLYEEKCLACHLENGEGIEGAFPPVWGDRSYNSGAGLSKLDKAAIWLQYNMPLADGGSLSDQEAVDITIYINAHDRPNFDLKDHIDDFDNYNSIVFEEKHTVESNFKAFGLDLKKIKGN